MQVGDTSPDVDPKLLKAAFNVTQQLIVDGKLLAGHDISDGGLATAVSWQGRAHGERAMYGLALLATCICRRRFFPLCLYSAISSKCEPLFLPHPCVVALS